MAPMIRMVMVSSQPMMTDSTTAGAYMTMPAARPLDNRNRKLVSERVFPIKALLQVLVCRKDLGPVKEGNEQHTQQYHYQGLRQIDLNELHAVVVGLSRGSDEGNSTGLGCHHRESNGSPGEASIGEIVTLHTYVLSAVEYGEGHHTTEVHCKDNPVKGSHGVL